MGCEFRRARSGGPEGTATGVAATATGGIWLTLKRMPLGDALALRECTRSCVVAGAEHDSDLRMHGGGGKGQFGVLTLPGITNGAATHACAGEGIRVEELDCIVNSG